MASASVLTLRGMVDAIIAIELESTRRVYDAPPELLTTADLPAMWPELPSANTNDGGIVCDSLSTDVTMDMVIAVEPFGQDTQLARFDLAVRLGDELRAALSNSNWTYSLFRDYTISTVADIPLGYWGIRATITARNQ